MGIFLRVGCDPSLHLSCYSLDNYLWVFQGGKHGASHRGHPQPHKAYSLVENEDILHSVC